LRRRAGRVAAVEEEGCEKPREGDPCAIHRKGTGEARAVGRRPGTWVRREHAPRRERGEGGKGLNLGEIPRRVGEGGSGSLVSRRLSTVESIGSSICLNTGASRAE